jgi:hypothetical protein
MNNEPMLKVEGHEEGGGRAKGEKSNEASNLDTGMNREWNEIMIMYRLCGSDVKIRKCLESPEHTG